MTEFLRACLKVIPEMVAQVPVVQWEALQNLHPKRQMQLLPQGTMQSKSLWLPVSLRTLLKL
jgi:hypothetical protein